MSSNSSGGEASGEGGGADGDSTHHLPMPLTVLMSLTFATILLLSLVGNSLVIYVIIRVKKLRNSTNYILLSLAIADLTVSILVMIPASIQDIMNKWIFNALFCQFYCAFDITCCTASILHLLLVAVDRYTAIFKPLRYNDIFKKLHVFLLVVAVWILSFCMSFIPIFLGLNKNFAPPASNSSMTSSPLTIAPQTNSTNEEATLCSIEANPIYAVISSCLSFYIPLVCMTIVYIRIYLVARRQAAKLTEFEMHTKRLSRDATTYNMSLASEIDLHHHQLSMAGSYSASATNVRNSSKNSLCIKNGRLRPRSSSTSTDTNHTCATGSNSATMQRLRSFFKTDSKRRTKDTKAIKTLGIIMGIFIICWLPFFIMYLMAPFTSHPPPYFVERLIVWIGYVNSFINPIVYALTNRDFRKAYMSTIKSLVKHCCATSMYAFCFGLEDIKKWNFKYYSAYADTEDIDNKSSCQCRYLCGRGTACYRCLCGDGDDDASPRTSHDKRLSVANSLRVATRYNNTLPEQHDADEEDEARRREFEMRQFPKSPKNRTSSLLLGEIVDGEVLIDFIDESSSSTSRDQASGANIPLICHHVTVAQPAVMSHESPLAVKKLSFEVNNKHEPLNCAEEQQEALLNEEAGSEIPALTSMPDTTSTTTNVNSSKQNSFQSEAMVHYSLAGRIKRLFSHDEKSHSGERPTAKQIDVDTSDHFNKKNNIVMCRI